MGVHDQFSWGQLARGELCDLTPTRNAKITALMPNPIRGLYEGIP